MADKSTSSEGPKGFGWQDSKPGLAIVVLFNLFGVYIFGTLAIKSGDIIGYIFTAFFLVLAVAQGIRLYHKVTKS